jgi:hypothetical protein
LRDVNINKGAPERSAAPFCFDVSLKIGSAGRLQGRDGEKKILDLFSLNTLFETGYKNKKKFNIFLLDSSTLVV